MNRQAARGVLLAPRSWGYQMMPRAAGRGEARRACAAGSPPRPGLAVATAAACARAAQRRVHRSALQRPAIMRSSRPRSFRRAAAAERAQGALGQVQQRWCACPAAHSPHNSSHAAGRAARRAAAQLHSSNHLGAHTFPMPLILLLSVLSSRSFCRRCCRRQGMENCEKGAAPTVQRQPRDRPWRSTRTGLDRLVAAAAPPLCVRENAAARAGAAAGRAAHIMRNESGSHGLAPMRPRLRRRAGAAAAACKAQASRTSV